LVRGQVEASYYQPIGSQYVGLEVSDPPFFDNSTNSACPAGRSCRYSDAVLGRYDSSVAPSAATLANTEWAEQDTGSVVIASWMEQGETIGVASPLAGDLLYKTGQTTGSTYGYVTSSCVSANVFETTITLLCQSFVNAAAFHGDSGSPVYYPYYFGQFNTLYGILWGGSAVKYGGEAADGNYFVFSHWNNVIAEINNTGGTLVP
ncbi:MAG: hypothetical protein ACT443_15295, partial [Gemmatimonadota bacterium]